MADFQVRLAALRATPISVPDFVRPGPDSHSEPVAQQLADTERQIISARRRLDALSARVAVLGWLFQTSVELQATTHTVRITGWTDSDDAVPLRAALDEVGVNHVPNGVPERPGQPPLVLDNPGWLPPVRAVCRHAGRA
ncbi:MAG: hypothetical protein GY717_00440 [Rhodobacteraceae bacterium]|nr:hypothetical protein [Paracoccaceae bacterium]